MADAIEDPREVPWHPRHAKKLVGHASEVLKFNSAIASGRPHHAWMLLGPRGIGKATFAYHMAKQILGSRSEAWVAAGAHPDLFVLQRSLTDTKPHKLRGEISVGDARGLVGFLTRTSASGGWRCVIVDSCDELNTESANAILKLVEEPPAKVIMMLVCHQQGRTLRTLRSRCQKLLMAPLSEADTLSVLRHLPLIEAPPESALASAAHLSSGSPGRALELVSSAGAKAFESFVQMSRSGVSSHLKVASHFSARAAAAGDYQIFMDLLLNWTAQQAKLHSSRALAEAHSQLLSRARIVEGYNLDRRNQTLDALAIVDDALKAG